MKAVLSNYRQSPRKIRLIADLIKGKSVEVALAQLNFADKKAAGPVLKLLESAVSNAKNNGNVPLKDLVVKDVRVDAGVTMKRMMPRAFGRGFPIKKRSSHVSLVLAPKTASAGKVKKEKASKNTK